MVYVGDVFGKYGYNFVRELHRPQWKATQFLESEPCERDGFLEQFLKKYSKQ